MRRADSFSSFISRHGQKIQAGSEHQQTGITQARQKVILGQAWVFERRTISREGLRKRLSNNMSNSPNEVQTDSERQGKWLIQDTQARIQD